MEAKGQGTSPRIFTVGHSNHSTEEFIKVLTQFDIQVLVDVRSQPYSKYVAHFNKHSIQQSIIDARLQYLFLGKELGGRG